MHISQLIAIPVVDKITEITSYINTAYQPA